MRNFLAHNAEFVARDKDEKRLREIAGAVPGLKIEHLDDLEIEVGFCEHALNAIQSFLESLRSGLRELCQRIRADEKL